MFVEYMVHKANSFKSLDELLKKVSFAAAFLLEILHLIVSFFWKGGRIVHGDFSFSHHI